MPNTRVIFKTHCRLFTSMLIFALAAPPPGYAQQPQQPRPEPVLQTGGALPGKAVFSPDGRLLASMDISASSIKLWEVATGRELHTIDLGPRALMTHILNSSFAFNSDGSSLFSVRTGTIKEWDTRTGRQIRAADLNQGADFGMACFSADARLLATTKLTRRSVAVWDVASERMLHELKVGEDLTFALSPDGRVLAINHEQGNEQENADAKQGFGKKLGRIIGVPGMNQEMVGVRRDVLTLLDTANGRVLQKVKIPEQQKIKIPEKKPLEKKIGEKMATSETRENRVIRFSPDGRAVAVIFNYKIYPYLSGYSDRSPADRVMNIYKIGTWDVSSGREVVSLDAGSQSAATKDPSLRAEFQVAFAFSNDHWLCAVVSGKTFELLDLSAGRNLATISGHTDYVYSVNFSADGKLLATTSLDGTIKIFDVSAAATGRVELARTLTMTTP